jgi:hypothetical protein
MSGCPVPAPPGTERLSHDEPLVLFAEPRQLLGEHRHALAPGTGHLGDVRAPEHSVGAERIVDLPQIGVQRNHPQLACVEFERIRRARVEFIRPIRESRARRDLTPT